jgi:hypothetical protein
VLLFAQGPVQLRARARSLFLVKNVRERADGHIGTVTYVSSPVTYLGEVAALPPRPSARLHAATLETGQYRQAMVTDRKPFSVNPLSKAVQDEFRTLEKTFRPEQECAVSLR